MNELGSLLEALPGSLLRFNQARWFSFYDSLHGNLTEIRCGPGTFALLLAPVEILGLSSGSGPYVELELWADGHRWAGKFNSSNPCVEVIG